MGDPERSGAKPPGARRLASATSAYLRSASEQPIEWFPWGSEPFELAERTQRPVLLDIGAAWCHWCHVMDEGTYADAEVARLLREHFIAVKVDRDEHPEVDRRYQRQVGVLTGEGGWPLTAFLTPKGEVFLGGTYFPPEDGQGRPGFRRVLQEVARLWTQEPEKIRGNLGAIQEALHRIRDQENPAAVSRSSFLQQVRSRIWQSYDPVHAGFGHAPKFPHPTAVSLLFYEAFASETPEPASRALETLRRMADGGMYDHVGGGFHRYSVDEGWHIPHFEKMAIDNAALLSAYGEGARWSPDPGLIDTARGIVAWSTGTLGDPHGGFAASQDADNAPGDDGSYFTWSRAELKQVLEGPELSVAVRYFGVGSEGRMPHDPDRNVLFRLMSPAEAGKPSGLSEPAAKAAVERVVAKLRAARSRRSAPVVDRALYAALNGAYIRALAQSSPVLQDPGALSTARRAADRFLRQAFVPGRGVAHRLEGEGASGFGLLEDQAEFALGLVELAGMTLDRGYFDSARSLLETIEAEFRAPNGLLRDIAPRLYDGPVVGSLAEASYPVEDNPHLSANAAAALAMIRFSSLSGHEEWRVKAEAIVEAMQGRVASAGLFAAGAALGAGTLGAPPARVVIEGEGAEADALERAARGSWHPDLWVFRGVPPEPFSLPEELGAGSGGPPRARALVCFGTRCLAPVTVAAELPKKIRSAGRGGSS
ncbi:MAG: thioredoxin domain-containing protein [Thermoplasmata archaeon]|nr:thioredoxin domain-containing protein [Thermoplasmata archaeon]